MDYFHGLLSQTTFSVLLFRGLTSSVPRAGVSLHWSSRARRRMNGARGAARSRVVKRLSHSRWRPARHSRSSSSATWRRRPRLPRCSSSSTSSDSATCWSASGTTSAGRAQAAPLASLQHARRETALKALLSTTLYINFTKLTTISVRTFFHRWASHES